MTESEMTTNLYERLGGRDAIAAVVAEMCARSLADDRINAKFVRTDPSRLEAMLVDQVAAATGGPFTYTGRSMADAHAGMAVTAAEFDAQVDDLVASLARFEVPQAEQDELIALLAPMRADIVEVESPETGTALPATYQNAPPLS